MWLLDYVSLMYICIKYIAMDINELFRVNTMYEENYFATVLEYSRDLTYKDSWNRIEGERIDIGLRERYTTYNSFRQAFYQYTHKTYNKKDRPKTDRSK